LINSLKNISAKHFFSEKIFVGPSFDSANQILENLARSGCSWINFRAETIISLASQIAETQIFKRNLEIITPIEADFLMDEIFTKLSGEGKLKYFKKFFTNKGIIKALSDNIAELKFAGITPKELNSDCFINENKAQDLKRIFDSYENILKEKSLIDSSSIICLANSILMSNSDSEIYNFGKDKIFIVSAKNSYKKIEKDFLNTISGSRLIVIGEKKIYNLERPKNRLIETNIISQAGCAVSRFSFLFDQQNEQRNIKESVDDINIEIFQAPNYRSEIYGILSKISSDRINADNTEIIYTNPEPYLELISDISEKLGLPATFSSGFPGDKSRSGKCLKGFLLWIKDDFPEVHLRNLLNYDLIRFEDKNSGNKATGSNMAFMLRTSKIGWGRERYETVLERSISEIKAKIEDTKNGSTAEEIINSYKNRLESLNSLKELTKNLLQIVPEIKNGKISFKQLCGCCLKFLSDFIKVTSEDEASFLKSLKGNIMTMEFVVEADVSVEEAVMKIIELIKDIRFLKSGPKPGHLFISDLESGGMSGRRNTFIVGMDENKFPGTQMQNPVLLDEEREKISSEIGLLKAGLKEKLYDFTSMLSGLEGKVTFSYAFYDIKNENFLYPSSVLLQIYREQSKENNADYDKMLSHLEKKEDPKLKSVNNIYIDESDFWINKLLSENNLKNARESVLKIYPWLMDGVNAINNRRSSKLTVYDGWINPPTDELDPRKNKDIVLSCTGIESFAHSPYTYFLEKILGVRRPEEIKKDLSMWLDPKMRGLLLHDVFQSYSEKIKTLSGYPDLENRKKLISAILNEKIEKFRAEVPIPGKAVFNQEVINLARDIDVFLEVDAALGKPFLLEYEFGYGKNEKASICIGEDQEGNERSISIAGKIDRVDAADINDYHVWDYKTGSSYSYEEEGYASQGRQLQHILYAKVIEKILKKTNPDARVSICGYILPTEKGRSSGKGCVFKRNADEKEKWQDALNCILELMASGVFIFSDESMPFFDDEDIYGTKSDKQNIKAKINDAQNNILEKWKELKKIK
jgi:ATP-dependent helicase/nuclease subunit B